MFWKASVKLCNSCFQNSLALVWLLILAKLCHFPGPLSWGRRKMLISTSLSISEVPSFKRGFCFLLQWKCLMSTSASCFRSFTFSIQPCPALSGNARKAPLTKVATVFHLWVAKTISELFIECGRPNNTLSICPWPNLWNLWMCYIIHKGTLKVELRWLISDFKIGRLPCYIQVGPV